MTSFCQGDKEKALSDHIRDACRASPAPFDAPILINIHQNDAPLKISAQNNNYRYLTVSININRILVSHEICSGRKSRGISRVSTRFSPSMENEQVDAGRDGRIRLARPNSQALTTSRIGNLTRLILTLAICDDYTYIHTLLSPYDVLRRVFVFLLKSSSEGEGA